MNLDDQNPKQDSKDGRENSLGERAPSTNFNPLQWSKWLYEIRRQLGRGTSRAEAYQDCHQHFESMLEG